MIQMYYYLPEELYGYWPVPVWGGFVISLENGGMFYWDSETGRLLPVSGEVFDVEEAEAP